MGQKVIIMIVVLMLAIGTMFVLMKPKQHKAADELFENTLSMQARHIANSYAEDLLFRIKDLHNTLPLDTLPTEQQLRDLDLFLTNVHNIPNSSVHVASHRQTYTPVGYLVNGSAAPISIPENNHLIVSIGRIEALDGRIYVARTHILYQYGRYVEEWYERGLEPSFAPAVRNNVSLDFTFRDPYVLTVWFHPGGSWNPHNYDSSNPEFQFTLQDIEAQFNTITVVGRAYIRGTINFPITIITESYFRISDDIKTENNSEINIYARQYIEAYPRQGGGSNQTVQVDANLYTEGNLRGNFTGTGAREVVDPWVPRPPTGITWTNKPFFCHCAGDGNCGCIPLEGSCPCKPYIRIEDYPEIIKYWQEIPIDIY